MKVNISKIRLKSVKGYENHKVYNCYDFPYDYFIFNKPKVLKKWKNKQVYKYLDLVCSFDTEATSYYIPDEDRWNSFTYLWGFCIDGFLVVGRTYEQFNIFIERLHNVLNLDKNKLIIYVHNLSYDWAFIWRFMVKFDSDYDLFAIDPRKILTFQAYGFEFRCSYRLFNMKLENACKNEKGCIYRKAAGDLNYKKFRLPTTGLTKKEWNYFILDLIALYDLIKNKLKNENRTLKNIPLTSTGFIRELLRDNCIGYGHSKKTKEQKQYKNNFKKLDLSVDVYNMLCWNVAGGDTHGNRKYIGLLQDSKEVGDLHSGDLQSSYPAVILLCDEFPISSYMSYGKIENINEFYKVLENYACLFFITFDEIEIKKDNPFDCISVSKIVNMRDAECDIVDNGRLILGHNVKLCLNQIDFELIKRNYNFKKYRVSNMQVAKKSFLPDAIRNTVYNLFKEKCELKIAKEKDKHNEDLAYNYGKFKNLINACFGCMLTNPVRPEIKLNDDGEWCVTPVDTEAALKKYYSSHKSFLHYAWGTTITSAARLALDNMRLACIGNNKGTALYWDTDSCKGYNFDFKSIEEFNKRQREKVIEQGFLVEIDGREFIIGDIDIETAGNPYKKFITLGAKKYAYEDDDGVHITVAGVKKKEGAKELKKIERFQKDFVFKSAGQCASYNDEDIHYLYIDGCKILTASNVALFDTTYTLHPPDAWLDFIDDGGDFIFD